MAKTFTTSVLTANDLVEGQSVFLTAEGWSPEVSRAMTAVSPEQALDLETQGARAVGENAVVGPYLVEVSMETGAPVPLTRRERIRASGTPSIPVGLAA